MPSGLLIAAPHSDAGKTTATLALLRALRGRTRVGAFKCGPDYIDPRFHARASGEECYNLDPWAMSDRSLGEIVSYHNTADICLTEGVMGLFDGAADGRGSTAELARRTGWPVVLVVDCKGLSDSIAPLVAGFRDFDSRVQIAGVILNRVGSANHQTRLREALAGIGVTVFGSLPRSEAFALPRRHLGLLQAAELPALETLLDAAADAVRHHIDLDTLLAAAHPTRLATQPQTASAHIPWIPDLGDRIAIADDVAFAFCYPHWRKRWLDCGVTLTPFSPLANESPASDATGIFLPGGYPELHAEQLAAADRFKQGIRAHANTGTPIYGECGGFMVLGDTLVDKSGVAHTMCGQLGVDTSFEERALHLGYRSIQADLPAPLGQHTLAAHEFHYSTLKAERLAAASATVVNAMAQPVETGFYNQGSVLGSYMHVIDKPA